MKKIIAFFIIFIMGVMAFVGIVNAATKDSLVNDLYALTSKYGVTEADKVKAERFLTENPITDEQASKIFEKAKEAIQVLEDAKVTDVKKLQTQLTREQKIKFEALCQETAALVGAHLTYKNGTVEVYKDGKKVEVFYFIDGKLPYTGNEINMTIIASGVAVIALATALIVRKKFANV